MKPFKSLFSLACLSLLLINQASFGQTFTTDVTVNTSVPSGHGNGYKALWLPNAAALMPEYDTSWSGLYLSLNMIRNASNSWTFANSSLPAWLIQMGNGSNSDGMQFARSAPSAFSFQTFMKISNAGNIGIGTSTPQTKLHVYGSGTSANATAQYNGNLIVEAAPGSRSSTTGASLEFVVPANTNGSNPWGQARIVTVAGNGNNSDATGKMILGTRRMFDKGTGSGVYWNYGDDIVIDGTGNVGINTANTAGYKFAVNGSAIATSMKVKLNANWPDFVFLKDYKLPTLTEVKTYIDKNQHLPDMPSADEVHANGLDLGEMNRLLLKKVEELTLYLIEKDKQDKEKEAKLSLQQKQIKLQQVNSELQDARMAAMEAAIRKLRAGK